MGDRGALKLPLRTAGCSLYPIFHILYPAPAEPGLAPRMSYSFWHRKRGCAAVNTAYCLYTDD